VQKAFVERLKTDEDFRQRVQDAEDGETRLAFAKAEGFDFTRDEIDEVASELSDDELDDVAGAGSEYVGCCRRGFVGHI